MEVSCCTSEASNERCLGVEKSFGSNCHEAQTKTEVPPFERKHLSMNSRLDSGVHDVASIGSVQGPNQLLDSNPGNIEQKRCKNQKKYNLLNKNYEVG